MAKKHDAAEWLYVLEINPGGRIKVGRTTDIRSRLTTHQANADFGGGEVVQIYTALCPDSRGAEFELIARLAARPHAEVVVGREMFTGVRFRAAVHIVEDIARDRRSKVQTGAVAVTGSLLDDCVAAFGGDERLHLEDLRARLAETHPEMYSRLTVLTLGSVLRDVGIRTRDIRLGISVRKGFFVSDFHRIRPGDTGETG